MIENVKREVLLAVVPVKGRGDKRWIEEEGEEEGQEEGEEG